MLFGSCTPGKKGDLNMKKLSALMALAMMTTITGSAFAQRRPSTMSRPVKIQPVNSSSQFKGRQTPKFRPSTIVIPPIDYAGGGNLAAAKASVAKALTDVKNEVKDQQRIIKGNKTRVTAAKKNIAKYKQLKQVYVGQRNSIQEEINVLEGISNPSSIIQTAIADLKTDLVAANKQIANTSKTVKEYEARLKFYNQVSKQAQANLKRLNTSVTHLTNAHKSLAMVKLPVPKPAMRRPIRFR